VSERPKMHAEEIEIDDGVVRRLVAEQFPQWSDRPIRRLPDSGTDSAIYRLGEDLGIRMPRVHWAADQVDREWRWLGPLEPSLPAAVPGPVGRGRPGHGYPHPWLVYPWIHGETLDRAGTADPSRLAADVAAFLHALEALPPAPDAPAPRRRGGPLAAVDAETRVAIRGLRGLIDVERALRVWQAGIDAGPWTGRPLWVHGDLLPGNIVVRAGRLAGVIDWSGLSVGDPACEAMLAWALPATARPRFRRALGFDEATWARGRAWVVEQTAFYIPYYETSLPGAVAHAKARLESVLFEAGPGEDA
jgi:aminoglycoside phosphotransferase (APT) family kinase protein